MTKLNQEEATYCLGGEPVAVVVHAVLRTPPPHSINDCILPSTWSALEPFDLSTVLQCVKCERYWRVYRLDSWGLRIRWELVNRIDPEFYDPLYYRAVRRAGLFRVTR